jgi:stearoyl-CoA desaturase (delta-9 desaturase)
MSQTGRIAGHTATRREHARTRRERAFIAAQIVLLHLCVVVALIAGTKPIDWLLFAILYPIQFAGVAICLHRYFAHHSFHTSRAFQFALALAAASSFGDPIRFAGKHRLHHQHADGPDDPHTPLHGFWASWFGSHVDSGYSEEEIGAQVPWLWRYPELRWLHRNSRLPALLLCVMAFMLGGFSTVAIGVLLGVVLVLHKSSAVNYCCHKFGSRRFVTDDQSTNNFLVALFTCGEGWHNNHHRYPVSARAGFRWWEIDMFYWVICVWEALGLVWDVRRPPATLLQTALPPELQPGQAS